MVVVSRRITGDHNAISITADLIGAPVVGIKLTNYKVIDKEHTQVCRPNEA
jgi:hypothetical protein